MASKLNNYPVERRLRPIYESLDTGNNKKALQEAEKVLRRQPGLLCAKALKCLALLRMGKESDCVELLEAVRKEEPVDDATLQAMTVCYREIHKPQVICEMYRLAYEKDPGNEEMLMHLFFSYARISDYNKQQQTAMALYKLRPKNQYYFWAIMSNLLQTRETAQEIMEYCLPPLFREDGVSKKVNQLTSSQNVCLKLSAKMIDRYLDKISSEQEILLWFVIQEMQGKLDEALKALEGPFGGKQPEICVRNRKADLLLKLGNWEEACRILRSLTDEFQDNWKYMKCYIFTVFRSWEVSKDAAEIKSATSFLNFNVTRGQQSTVPLLGWLEFYCELKRRQLPTHGLDIVWVLMKYMRGFGAADCSLHNLKPYLPYLSSVEAKDFLNQVWSLVALGENELPKNKNEMHLHVCNLELARCLRDSDNILEYNRTIVLTCLRYYVHSQIFCDGLPITEPRPSDRYALLAAHALYECWVETNNSNYLFDCIVICHYALNYSPSNSQFKLLLLKLYHILGGCQGAQEAYISLDIKHMQLDTLGYLHVFPLIMNGYYSYALSVLNVTLKFFTNNYKDSADHITYAYKYDAYTKIPEFIVIRERLNNSVHYYLSSVENTLIDVLHTQSHSVATEVLSEIDVTPHRDYIQWSKLQDNRDLNVLWELDKEENCLNKKVIEQTLNHDLVLLRLRTILLRMIVGVVQISGTHPCENMNGVEKKNISDFDNCNINESSFEFIKSALITLTETLEEELKTLNDNMPSPVARKIIAAPPDSRLILLLTTNYFGLILDEMRFMFDLISGENVGPDESQLHLSVILLYFECLLSLISNGIIEEDNLKHINTLLQTCAIFVELVCFTCIIISSCDMFLKHNKQTLAKKNKKKKESNVEKERTSAEWKFDLIDKLSECMTESIDVVVSILKSLEKKLREKNIVLGRLIISSKIESKEEKEKLFNISGLVNESLTGSYITSIGLMLKVLKQKVKYLTSLKQ